MRMPASGPIAADRERQRSTHQRHSSGQFDRLEADIGSGIGWAFDDQLSRVACVMRTVGG